MRLTMIFGVQEDQKTVAAGYIERYNESHIQRLTAVSVENLTDDEARNLEKAGYTLERQGGKTWMVTEGFRGKQIRQRVAILVCEVAK